MGLYQSRQWTIRAGLGHVSFELDCKQVVDDTLIDKIGRSKYGSLIHECRNIKSKQFFRLFLLGDMFGHLSLMSLAVIFTFLPVVS